MSPEQRGAPPPVARAEQSGGQGGLQGGLQGGVDQAAGPAAVGVPVALPGFEVLSELGGGAGSTVYRVRRVGVQDDEEYALKLLHRALETTANARGGGNALTALRREAALLTAVDHPGLPRVHEVGLADRRPYLVMDLVRGTSLADVLSRGSLSAERVVALTLDVIEPLAAVHARGLVHRDLKPQNIMVLPDGRGRLIDFGLTAREGEDDDEETPLAVGTLAYSAPEQSGMLKRPVDDRSDLYSLGVIMFEALAGVLPFQSLDVGELLRAHASLPPPDLLTLLPDTPPELAHVVATLLAKDPDDRYQDGRSLAADLRVIAGRQEGSFRADRPTMFGRQPELDALLARWTEVRRGHGGFAFVSGEHGLGRTRLAQEFGDLVEESGGTVLRSRVLEGDTMPFAPFRAAFTGYLQQLSGMPLGERWERQARLRAAFDGWSPGMISRIAPGLENLLRQDSEPQPHSTVDEGRPSVPTQTEPVEGAVDPLLLLNAELGVPDDGNDDQFALAVATVLTDLARSSGGLLLVVDDVTAADSNHRQVILHLARQAPELPLLHLATGIDDGRFEKAMAEEPDQAAFVEQITPIIDPYLRLEPLDETAIGAQIRSLIPGTQLPDAALAALTTRSNGNPFIAQEYLWAVLDAGLLWPSWGTWQLDLENLDALDLPQDAMGLILNRVQHLAPQARDLLVTGAAMGAEVRVDVVAAVERRSTTSVHGVFSEAVRHRLMEPGEEGTFRFLHGRIAEAMLAELPAEQQQDRHLRIAQVLAARPPSGPAQVSGHTFAIARHYLLAGPAAPAAKVLTACVEAGRLALEESAADEAVSFLEQAVRLTPRRSPESSQVLVLLGRALKQAGQFGAARSRLEQALGAEPDPLAQAAIHTQLAEVHRAGYRSEELTAAIGAGFAAIGKPLPRSTFWLLLSSILMALVSIPRRWLRPLLGDVEGGARKQALTMAGLHEAAIVGASLGMRVPEFIAHNLRGLYWAARLGHGRRFVAAQANMGVLFAAISLNRAGERCFRRCDTDLSAQTPPIRSMLRSFRLGGAWAGNRPEGLAWRRQFDDFSPWLEFAPLIDSITVFNLTACFAGRTEEAGYWLAQGRSRLTERTGEITTFVTAAPMTAALRGHSVEAETEMTRLTQEADRIGARQLRFIQVMAGLFVMLEEGETGAPLDQVIAEFDELRLSPGLVWRAHRPIYHLVATARMAQARAAGTPAERERRLGLAHQAVEMLGKAANTEELKAFWTVAKADLLVLQGQERKALDQLAELGVTLEDDLPTVAFEAARIAARALRTLNPAEGRRRARAAYSIAGVEGWPQRAAAVVTEFSLPVEDRSLVSTGTGPGLGHSTYSGSHERERLEALQAVSAAAARVLDQRVLARIALDETIRILAADRAFLFLADRETGALSQYLGRDSAGQDLATLTGYSTSLVEMVHRTRQAQVVAGTEEGAALGAQSVVLHGLRSILVGPMMLDGRLLGVVYLDSQVAKGIFTSGDAVILSALTSFVASSLETAHAAQLAIKAQTAERAAELAKALQQVQERMASSLEPLGVLNQLLHACGRAGGVLAADTAFVVRPERSGTANQTGVTLTPGEKQPVITAFTDDGSFATLSDLEGPVCGTALDAPTLLRDRLPGLTSWAVLPLRATDIDLGVLALAGADPETSLAGGIDLAAAVVAQGMTAWDRAHLFEKVQELAVVDELTQLFNRRKFFEIAARDLEAALRQDRPLIGMMMDIDHFKRVNDTYGHPTGDDVIKEVARRLSEQVRSTDVIGRYGGEEFAVLQQGDDPELELAERLRACVGDTPIRTRRGMLPITISVGVAHLRPDDEDVAGLLARADQSLYQAKHGGRNKVGEPG